MDSQRIKDFFKLVGQQTFCVFSKNVHDDFNKKPMARVARACGVVVLSTGLTAALGGSFFESVTIVSGVSVLEYAFASFKFSKHKKDVKTPKL